MFESWSLDEHYFATSCKIKFEFSLKPLDPPQQSTTKPQKSGHNQYGSSWKIQIVVNISKSFISWKRNKNKHLSTLLLYQHLPISTRNDGLNAGSGAGDPGGSCLTLRKISGQPQKISSTIPSIHLLGAGDYGLRRWLYSIGMTGHRPNLQIKLNHWCDWL